MKERKVNPAWIDRDYGYQRSVKIAKALPWYDSIVGTGEEIVKNYVLDALASLCERYKRCPYEVDWEDCGGSMLGGCASCIEQMAYDGEPFPLDLFDRRK